MDIWLFIGIGIGSLATLTVARAIRARLERQRRPRVVEAPNSHYTSKLVLDRDAHERWKAIPLEKVHEINREEVRRLLAKVEEYGVDQLTGRERTFLDRIAELNPPSKNPRRSDDPRNGNDSIWSDPFGFQPPLGSRPGSQ